MRIRADFSKKAVVNRSEADWISSPESGVDRIMLDRIGDEVARATSIVRYAPGSKFSRHEHAIGEEFFVLAGVFSDEHGDYPAGTYVRNPPGSGHSPFSTDGCRIFVKLRQFDPADLSPVVIDTGDARQWRTDEAGQAARIDLHKFGNEKVQMLRLPKGYTHGVTVGRGGIECLVIDGEVGFAGQVLPEESWLRLPEGADLQLLATEETTLWVKTGHLPDE
jgi:anti-sigma factor ChrR (cupin superfamily)